MSSPKSIAIIMAVCLLAFTIMAVLTGDHGPSGSLIKSAMEKDLKAQLKDCVIKKMTYARGNMFLHKFHADDLKAAALFPVRVEATYTATLDDGSRSDPTVTARVFYFYKDPSGKWTYQRNNF